MAAHNHFDVGLLDRAPPEPAAEPACRSCTILLDNLRPDRKPFDLPDTLGQVCGSCYATMQRHMSSGLSLPAALAAATWGTWDI